MNVSPKAWGDFVAVMCEALLPDGWQPHAVVELCAKLKRNAVTRQRYLAQECNGPALTEADRKRLAQCEARILNALGDTRVSVNWEDSQDARGSLKLLMPNRERYNTMGGREAGWAVPI